MGSTPYYGSYSDPHESSQHLISDFIKIIFNIILSYTPLVSKVACLLKILIWHFVLIFHVSNSATWPTQLILLDLVTQIIFREDYKFLIFEANLQEHKFFVRLVLKVTPKKVKWSGSQRSRCEYLIWNGLNWQMTVDNHRLLSTDISLRVINVALTSNILTLAPEGRLYSVKYYLKFTFWRFCVT